MKKFAAMLMLVCTLGVVGVMGCEGEKKPTVPTPTPKATPEKTGEKMGEKSGEKTTGTTPPATPETPAKK